MAKQINKRIDDLERRTKPKDGGPVVILSWGDKPVIVDGEQMTVEVYRGRYPNWEDNEQLYLTWGDDDSD